MYELAPQRRFLLGDLPRALFKKTVGDIVYNSGLRLARLGESLRYEMVRSHRGEGVWRSSLTFSMSVVGRNGF